MSVVPKPPTVPKPKRLAQTNDAATAEHEALLRRVWRNLDGIVDLLFSRDMSEFKGSVEHHVDVYLRACKTAAEEAKELVKIYGTDPRAAAMRDLADRLSKVEADSVPRFRPEMADAKIDKRTLQKTLTEWKTSAGEKRAIAVGYVDIECIVTVPKHIALRSQLPNFVDSENIIGQVWFERTGGPEKLTLQDIRKPLEEPYWTTEDSRYQIWIDVRVSALALGQLVRELKTLRSYGAGGADVLVVMPTADVETKELLANEGFEVLDCEWLSRNKFD